MMKVRIIATTTKNSKKEIIDNSIMTFDCSYDQLKKSLKVSYEDTATKIVDNKDYYKATYVENIDGEVVERSVEWFIL